MGQAMGGEGVRFLKLEAMASPVAPQAERTGSVWNQRAYARRAVNPIGRSGGERAYRMAMVASAREEAPPMLTTSGTALPVGALAGMSRLICTSPEYTRPAKTTLAAGTWTPPRLILTGSMGLGKAGPVGWVPSARVVFTRPCPVSQNST